MSLTDLFVVGLGFDIAGATLLAKALLLDVATIRSLGTWGGVGFGATVQRCRDRVDAEVGLSALGLGFLLQAIGYCLAVAGVEPSSGARETAVAVGLGLAAMLAVFWLWKQQGERRLKGLLVGVALSKRPGDPTSEWSQGQLEYLGKLAWAAGWKHEPGEREAGNEVFVARIFNLELDQQSPR